MQLEAVANTTRTQPLGSTIYTFSYLYDRGITIDSYLFTALIESVHSLGAHIFETAKSAGQIKEDDVSISGFSFSRHLKSHEEVSELLLQAEKKFEIEHKKSNSLIIKMKIRQT